MQMLHLGGANLFVNLNLEREVPFISGSLDSFSWISIILSDVCCLLFDISMVFVFSRFGGQSVLTYFIFWT